MPQQPDSVPVADSERLPILEDFGRKLELITSNRRSYDLINTSTWVHLDDGQHKDVALHHAEQAMAARFSVRWDDDQGPS